MPLITALQFVGACLLLGVGLLVAIESFLRIRKRMVPAVVSQTIAGVGGIAVAVLGGYWAASQVHW